MDPNATLAEIQWFLDETDEDPDTDLLYALDEWLKKGGFEPDWQKYPQATDYFRFIMR